MFLLFFFQSSSKFSDQVNTLESKIESIVKTNNILFRDTKVHLNQVRANLLVDKIRLFKTNENTEKDVKTLKLEGPAEDRNTEKMKVLDNHEEKSVASVVTEGKVHHVETVEHLPVVNLSTQVCFIISTRSAVLHGIPCMKPGTLEKTNIVME